MYLDSCFMSQTLIISNIISFDYHFKPCNLGWYVSVLILYVFSILKLACIFFFWLRELFDCFSFSCTVYILPFIFYMNF